MDAAPVEASKQHIELYPRQPHAPVANLRPSKCPLFQPLVDHHDAAAVPEQDLDPVTRSWSVDEAGVEDSRYDRERSRAWLCVRMACYLLEMLIVDSIVVCNNFLIGQILATGAARRIPSLDRRKRRREVPTVKAVA